MLVEVYGLWGALECELWLVLPELSAAIKSDLFLLCLQGRPQSSLGQWHLALVSHHRECDVLRSNLCCWHLGFLFGFLYSRNLNKQSGQVLFSTFSAIFQTIGGYPWTPCNKPTFSQSPPPQVGMETNFCHHKLALFFKNSPEVHTRKTEQVTVFLSCFHHLPAGWP